MEGISLYAAILCGVLIAIIFYFIGYAIAKSCWRGKYLNLDLQLKNLITSYNKDTAELHRRIEKLENENVSLIVKLKNTETDMLSYRTKMKSIESDNIRLKECKGRCNKHCEKKLSKKPMVVNEQPKKKIGRPKKNG